MGKKTSRIFSRQFLLALPRLVLAIMGFLFCLLSFQVGFVPFAWITGIAGLLFFLGWLAELRSLILSLAVQGNQPSSGQLPPRTLPTTQPPAGQTSVLAIPQVRIGLVHRKDTAPAVWEVGDIILGEYEVTANLGQGGMGVVHKVHFYGSNSDLAVKSPRPEIFTRMGGKENFIHEAETWMRLGKHSHIVNCYFVRMLGGIPRVFAEYVDGGSLVEAIRSRRLYQGGHDQALERILDLAIQFAWGLHAAHEQGLVHQDVKPANVMLTREGVAKITDFGLAKARALAGESDVAEVGQSILVTTGGLTPAYCSPEQAARQPLSRKTDIWSWGVSVLEMFVGRVTWGAGAVAREALASHQGEDEVIPAMPPAIVTLLNHCFQPRPEDRPATMLEVAGELQTIYEQLLGRSYSRQAPDPSEKRADMDMIPSLAAFGRPEEALAVAEQAIQLEPGNANIHLEKGIVLRELGRPEEALLAFEQAIQLEPKVAHYHYNSGNVLVDLGRQHWALKAYGRASYLEPKIAYYHYKQGDVLMFLGFINPSRFPEALQAFERAIQLNPRLGIAHQKKGDILSHLKRPAEALQAFEQAIQMDPRNAHAYHGKGNALQDLGRLREAEVAFQQAERVSDGEYS